MPSLGTTSRWPGYAAPTVALLLTLVLSWAMARLASVDNESGTVLGLALLILMPAPMVVAVVWGGAVLTGRPHRLALVAAAIWLLVSWLLVPHDFTYQLAGYVVAGLLAGVAIGVRWRLDLSVLVVALALCPILVWSSLQVPVSEQLDLYRGEMLKALEKNLPANASETQRTQALAEEKRKLDQVTGLAAKIYPSLLGVGVLGQAGIILALVWLGIKALGMAPQRWRLPPFTAWRVPFYVVWVLVLGLGLLVTRQPVLANAGLNLTLLAAGILSVQGTAIQFHVTGRLMSGAGRVVYWAVMGIFFAPLVMASGVVLGLVDQWWDIRRLDREGLDDGDDNSDDDLGTDAR